jgi:hypothetical protein
MSLDEKIDETLGNLDSRLLKIEEISSNTDWFGQHPIIVLAIVITTLVSAFWLYYTYEVDRIEKRHLSEVSRLESRHQLDVNRLEKANTDKVTWLQQQNSKEDQTAIEKCKVEKLKINNILDQCQLGKNITSQSTRTK